DLTGWRFKCSFIGTNQRRDPKYRQQVKTQAGNPNNRQGRKLRQRVNPPQKTGKKSKNQETNPGRILYFISSETKKWAESRKYCTNKGADLIIINDKEEQDFVKNISGDAKVWIGLTDQSVEGRWKWVDGSNVTFRFWENGQTNKIEEDCALNYSPGWADFPCGNNKIKTIAILQLSY
uniref:C-type lectin domain-containing protein n=1 Tax=Sinocyclocheilus anshuiensis TaxID=1608454 RepID=A0A671MRD3_9TELE